MSAKTTISAGPSTGRVMSVLLMAFCLTFLTTLNFFLYQQSTAQTQQLAGCEDSGQDYPPSGPTEEKAPGTGFSIVEEMLHEVNPELHMQAINQLYLHHIAEAEKIELFHPELILPPPKQVTMS